MPMSMCTEAGCRGPRGGADHMSQLLLFSARWNLPIRSWFIMVCSGLFHNSDLFQILRTFFLDENSQLQSSPFCQLNLPCFFSRRNGAGCGSNWQPPHSLLPGGSLGAGLSQELDPESLGVLARPFRNPWPMKWVCLKMLCTPKPNG